MGTLLESGVKKNQEFWPHSKGKGLSWAGMVLFHPNLRNSLSAHRKSSGVSLPGDIPEPSRAPGSPCWNREFGATLVPPDLSSPGILSEFYPISFRNSCSASKSSPGCSGKLRALWNPTQPEHSIPIPGINLELGSGAVLLKLRTSGLLRPFYSFV